MKIRHVASRQTIAGLSLVAVGLTGGAVLSTLGTANAASTASDTASAAPTRPGETPLTGATLASVKSAVLAKYPGATFAEVTTERDGGYEARITDAAGKRMSVLVSTAFAVTGLEAHRPGFGRPGPGHLGPGGAGETALTGPTLASVKAAVLAKYPGATFDRVETDRGGVYEAHIVTAAGERVRVALDKAFAITATE